MWTAIISAVSGIVRSVSGSIDKSNAYYTQRQSDSVSGRNTGTITRTTVVGIVAVVVLIVFINLSKSE